MNDKKLMEQNREYHQILLTRDKRPETTIFTFRDILQNIDNMKLDESKIHYVIELKEMFLKLKAHWTDMVYNSTFDKKNKNEIHDSVAKYLKMFNEIIQAGKQSTEISLAEKANELSEEALSKAKRSNIIAVISCVVAFLALLVAILIGVLT